MTRGRLIGLVAAVALATVALATSGGAAHDRAPGRQVAVVRTLAAVVRAPARRLTRGAIARRALSTAGLRGRLRRELAALERAGRRPRTPVRSRSVTVLTPRAFAPPAMSCPVSGSGGCSLTPCLYFVPARRATTATVVGPGRRAPAAGGARRSRSICLAPRKPTRPITA